MAFPIIEWQRTEYVTDMGNLQSAIMLAQDGLNTQINLMNNIPLTMPLNVPHNVRIKLTSIPEGPFAIDATGHSTRIMEINTGPDENVDTFVYFSNIILRGGYVDPMAMDDMGGAIFSHGQGNAIIKLEPGALFENNSARSGGAIALESGVVGVFGGQLINNHAKSDGGAVLVMAGHPTLGAFQMNMDNSLIADNESEADGGGVYIACLADVTISGGSISNNTAAGYGGGLHTRNMLFNGGMITGNTAGFGGGGIVLRDVGVITGTAVLSSNTAPIGGGIAMGDEIDTHLDISGDARIRNNTASADGGGIYLAEAQLAQLTISGNAQFTGNSAAQGYAERLPIHDAVYLANIHINQWSANFIQGYNNYDIRYNGNNPPGCHVDGQQMIDVCLPVSVTPMATVGNVTTRCCGPAIITRGDNVCPGIPNGTCNFTIRQRMCVKVPVDFGAIVTPGEPHILCTDDGCDNCPDMRDRDTEMAQEGGDN